MVPLVFVKNNTLEKKAGGTFTFEKQQIRGWSAVSDHGLHGPHSHEIKDMFVFLTDTGIII